MESKFKIGDRVQYTGDATKEWIGKLGTVTEVDRSSSVCVKWDGDAREQHYWPFVNNITKVDVPPGITVEQALAVLRANGEVSYKPAFKPVTVDTVIANHKPVVWRDHVEIGCTNVSFESVEKVWAAIQKVKETQ